MTAWKDGLKMLMRQPPSDGAKRAVLDIMQGTADDRSASLISGALADTGLMLGIGSLEQPTSVDDLFWKRRRPKYARFVDRITGAYDLGLIGPDTKDNLDVIREVRNAFAHSMIELTFSTPEIVAACDTLTVSEPAQFFIDQEVGRKTRYRYCYACHRVFADFLAFAGALWISGVPPQKPSQPILP